MSAQKVTFVFILALTLSTGAKGDDTKPLLDAGVDSTPAKQVDAGQSGTSSPVAPALPEDRKPTFKLSLEPTELSVGEVATWRLEATRRVGDRVHLSSGASFGKMEVRGKDSTQGEPRGEWILETLEIELIGFEPGDVEIPAQKITVVDSEGRIGEFETEPRSLKIKSLIANEPEPALKEDTGPGVPVFEKDYTLLWILGILGATGVIALLTLLIRWLWSKRKPRPEPPPPPPRPAHEIALEKLAALRRSNLLEEGNIKEFHVRLSETIREYLGNRYHFDSLELSSEELIEALGRTSIGKTDFQETVDFLSETDLVKFAKMIPTLEESRGLLDLSETFIDKTTPKTFPEEASRGGTQTEGGNG